MMKAQTSKKLYPFITHDQVRDLSCYEYFYSETVVFKSAL